MSKTPINPRVAGYVFNNPHLLERALTHSSFTNEHKLNAEESNERLEFLGDAVLELLISEHIFVSHPTMSEGEMTKLRANIVCEQSLHEAAKNAHLGSVIRMGKGEERSGGRERPSILSDCFEAIIGALFVDGGIEKARDFVLNALDNQIKECHKNFKTSDFKTYLQEHVQKYNKEPLEYTVIQELGPAHDRTFVIKLTHDGKELAVGQGKSKKEAEQDCAGKALERMGIKT